MDILREVAARVSDERVSHMESIVSVQRRPDGTDDPEALRERVLALNAVVRLSSRAATGSGEPFPLSVRWSFELCHGHVPVKEGKPDLDEYDVWWRGHVPLKDEKPELDEYEE